MSGGSHDRRKSRRLLENAVEKIVSEKYTVPLAASEKLEGKPVAMWLGAAAIAIGIIYWLIPEKTLSRVVVSLLAIFVLLVHPVWNFWWIEKKLWSRILALLVLAVGLSTLGYFTWQSRARVIEQLNALAGKNDWNTLAKRLDSLDHNQELRDVDLYYRGLLYSNARPAPDPETYLSQVPQESDLFLDAQRLRMHNYSLAPSERLAKAIFDSLDRASILNPIYYRFKLELTPNLSYNEIASLYEEFAMRHGNLFDFTNMKSAVNVYQGVYTSFDLNDIMEIPECILLFLSHELTAADNECLLERKAEVLDRYDMLARNIGDDNLTNLRWVLALDPSVKGNIEQRRQSSRKCITGKKAQE